MTAQDPYRPHLQPPQAPLPHMPPPPVHGQVPYAPAGQFPTAHPYWSAPAPVVIDGFVVVQPRLKPIPSGPAIGSLVAGIGGITAGFPGLLFALASAGAGYTFFMFSALFGTGSVALAVYARRQIRAAGGGVSGRGVATTGLVLGIVLLSIALLTVLVALAWSL